MADFLEVTMHTGDKALVNVQQIASITVHRATNTGKIIGTRIAFAATYSGGDNPGLMESWPMELEVKDDFDDVRRFLGAVVNIQKVRSK